MAATGPSLAEKGKASLGLFIQPACLQHRYIRHANASHIFERPERLRAVLLGVAAAAARLEADEGSLTPPRDSPDDLSALLSGLSIGGWVSPPHLVLVPPPTPPSTPGQVLLHHPAVQLSHAPPPTSPFPYFPQGYASSSTAALPSSAYLKDLFEWASEAVEKIKTTGCEIPGGLGLNQGDLYLGPGSILAIEGAIQTVCQAIDRVCAEILLAQEPTTPPISHTITPSTSTYFPTESSAPFSKAFCAIRPPGHHCGEDSPSGFCYVNNVIVGAMHAYLQHDIDRAIIIDFDLHHGNGTQALVMPLNAASHAEDIAVKAGKPPTSMLGKKGKRRRGWKGFYGSVHDIYSYPCEDGDIDLVKDASLSLAAHGQYIENIHLQPYTDEADFYRRIYPKYLALLDKAKRFMLETGAEADRTIVLISAGFDACEHEHQGMQRHDRRVPTSFFSRYTKDIASFADEFTEGKVVSVLEGGYSDRALTSAAMGHVIGMLGREGHGGWWNEAELCNIEKATKKKRTGKIAPFPPELSHLPYLQRTHALLAHFEGPSPEAGPSNNSTPQQQGSGRMTLRQRKQEDEVAGTPTHPARRAVGVTGGVGGGRGKVLANGTPPEGLKANATMTPSGKSRGKSPIRAALPASASAPILASTATLERSPAGQEGLVKALAEVKLEPKEHVPPAPVFMPTLNHSSVLSRGGPPDFAPSISVPTVAPASLISAPPVQDSNPEGKIFLRFSRPKTASASPEPPEPHTSGHVYPSLPAPTPVVDERSLEAANLLLELSEDERMAYRESSANTTSTEGEYLSANSGDSGRGWREGSAMSGSSDGVGMPGKFGRP